ncbi:MAG TPA: RodZ domain-containing protein [Wenzhouxiangella sp.]
MTVTHSSKDEMTLSQRLAAERVARGWSVQDVAEQLGASASVVRQLESDEAIDLAGIYRDAYLRRYLNLMGLGDSGLVGSDLPQLQVVLPMPKRRRWLEKTMGWARYAVASLIIVPPLLWFSINHSTSWITGGLADSAKVSPVELSEPRVRHLQASQIPARALGGGSQESLGSSQQTPENDFGLDGVSSTVPTPLIHVLKVRLSEDSWLEVRDSEGKRLEHNLLRADSEYSYQGEPPFEVFVGLGSAVEFELNGQSIEHLESTQAEGLMEFKIDASGGVIQKQ